MNKTLFLILSILILYIESNSISASEISGNVLNELGTQLQYAKVLIKSDEYEKGVFSNKSGEFRFSNLKEGSYQIEINYIGYKTIKDEVVIYSGKKIDLNYQMEVESLMTNEVFVEARSDIKTIKESAFEVNVVEIKKYENRNIDVNPLLTRSAGVRVRESGGLGSDFSYSLNGMSGRSIRFYVDGVPIDRFGAGYSINNYPVNLIESIEIYKGVVPPSFGGDALGGVVNVKTKSGYNNYADLSYSIGSFGTHRVALAGRWADMKTGLFTLVQGYYNYSLNNYEVWGKGVEIANPITGRAQQIRTRRFHNTFSSYSGKLEIGIQDNFWADKLSFSFLMSDFDSEIQHGATMARVFGEAKRLESSWSPTLQYKKNDLFLNNLDLNFYSSYTQLYNDMIDTSSRIYDWSGKVIDEGPRYSELGFGNNGKSLLTLKANNFYNQGILNYTLLDNHYFTMSYTYDFTNRIGSDPFEGDRTAGFRSPQNISKQVTSIAYEMKLYERRISNTFWIKNYDFKANSVDQIYITDDKGYRPIEFPIRGKTNNMGFGIASKYEVFKSHIFKISFENAYRLPDVDEILGDGFLVKNNPNLKPEQSYNLNLSYLLSDYKVSTNFVLNFEFSLFYRDVNNLILYVVQENRGIGLNENIGEVIAKGFSAELSTNYKSKFEIKGNFTYQDIRDKRMFIGPNRNETYMDRLRNTPYFMANGGIYYNFDNLISNDRVSFFWDLQYVHEFFLNWPSLGMRSSKAIIPTQLINNIGIVYSFSNDVYNISLECNNIFDKQVYDNYLIQKPGRAYSAKFRFYFL